MDWHRPCEWKPSGVEVLLDALPQQRRHVAGRKRRCRPLAGDVLQRTLPFGLNVYDPIQLD